MPLATMLVRCCPCLLSVLLFSFRSGLICSSNLSYVFICAFNSFKAAHCIKHVLFLGSSLMPFVIYSHIDTSSTFARFPISAIA
uniref:Putative secreted protein n=1 Tax=Anopheles triannulatus TaxID=58253 RepID=A0A2M4B5J8_9DIPT